MALPHPETIPVMRGQDAARAVANHLLLDASPDIRWNKAHYRTLYPDRDEIFRPEMVGLVWWGFFQGFFKGFFSGFP